MNPHTQIENIRIFGKALNEMETVQIDILNPKAKALLKNLAKLDLIRIKSEKKEKSEFSDLLKKLRSKSDTAPGLDEITAEVEAVRKARYEK